MATRLLVTLKTRGAVPSPRSNSVRPPHHTSSAVSPWRAETAAARSIALASGTSPAGAAAIVTARVTAANVFMPLRRASPPAHAPA